MNDAESGDFDRTVSATRLATAKAPARWIVYGRITDPRASKLDLGAFTLSLANGGFFLKNIDANDWSKLSGTVGRGQILDPTGHVLRHGCVSWVFAERRRSRWGVSAAVLARERERHGNVHGADVAAAGGGRPGAREEAPRRDAHAELLDLEARRDDLVEAAPASDGSTCIVVNGPNTPADGFGASNCVGTRIPVPGTEVLPPIKAGLGAQLAHAGDDAFYAWDVSGTVDPSFGIAKLELQSDDSVLRSTSAAASSSCSCRRRRPGRSREPCRCR